MNVWLNNYFDGVCDSHTTYFQYIGAPSPRDLYIFAKQNPIVSINWETDNTLPHVPLEFFLAITPAVRSHTVHAHPSPLHQQLRRSTPLFSTSLQFIKACSCPPNLLNLPWQFSPFRFLTVVFFRLLTRTSSQKNFIP